MDVGKRDVRIVVPEYGIEGVLALPNPQCEIQLLGTGARAVAVVYHRRSKQEVEQARRELTGSSTKPAALVELLRVRVFDRVPVALTAVVDTSPQTLQCALELPSPA